MPTTPTEKSCNETPFIKIVSLCPVQAAPRMRSFQRYKRCGASHAPPRARGRRPRRAVDERFIRKHKPAHRETNDSRHWTNRSFLSLSHSRATECSASRTVRNCPHAGQAVPSGTPSEGYYRELKLCRKFMSIGSRCKPIAVPPQAPRMRGFQRHKRCGASHAPPRARGRRPRRAVDERLHSHEIKPAQRETNDSRHWTNRSFLSLSRFTDY